jgi:hypothetical protein
MNNRPLVRKIIYIAAIGVLIIPLSIISLPETRKSDGTIKNAGGVLSQLRDEHNLSQAKLTEVDPTSETMKLASLGLRGVAVNVLWSQAIEQKKNADYDGLASTLNALTKVQPNFVRVWEYQAHNLAYNVSMEFDDYEYRYTWVKKGLEFLKGGIRYNKQDHRITDNLGFFTGNKFGKSDENKSFRRLFREDNQFHDEMSDRLDPQSYDVRDHGHDSWKMAYQWYDYSRNMVANGVARKKRNDILFYMFRPAQLRNMGVSLQTEFPTRSVIQEAWNDAHVEWMDYGNQELINSIGTRVTLEGTANKENELVRLREKLDGLVPPNTRRDLTMAMLPNSPLSKEEQEEYTTLSEIDVDQLSNDQQQRLRRLRGGLESLLQELDQQVALKASAENRTEAAEIIADINTIRAELRVIGRDAQTVNYGYWVTRTKTEAEQRTADAQLALHEAGEVWKQSIYDDEFDFDYRTKKKTVTRKGAITLYEEAFKQWKPIFEENPELADGQLSDRVAVYLKEYYSMLNFTNREWPKDFPLQELIDKRFEQGDDDGLPTTESLSDFDDAETPPSASNYQDPDQAKSIPTSEEVQAEGMAVPKTKSENAGGRQ